MEKFEIKFNDVEDVSKFVHVVSQYDVDVDLYCGSYCVDAKSILGIMTMDLRIQCGSQQIVTDTRESA